MKSQLEAVASVNEQEVVRFLEDNLDFFKSHSQLLADLEVPHESGRAISLVERQLGLLREQKRYLKRQLQDLLQIAQENEQINQRIHHFTLKLIATTTVAEIITLLRTGLTEDFQISCSEVWLFIDPAESGLSSEQALFDADNSIRESFEHTLQRRKAVCGRYPLEQMAKLFPGQDATLIKSAALVPLFTGRTLGLLALGSDDGRRFHSSKGTEILGRLGELSSALLGVRL